MAKISRKEIFSIPNLMGYFRILMIPVFSWMYLTASTREDVYRAAAVVFISSVTDLLDGLGGPAVSYGHRAGEVRGSSGG